ncbi:MAG: hypothetical protein GEU98_28230 [Pseudonocardiaceae bacterium]|nr:hypothetical protein [Pseudonocardiaceae bacterium]
MIPRSAARLAGRLAVLLAAIPGALVLGANAANAANAVSAQQAETSSGSALGIFGPVGLIAVAIGLGGLVIGLLRHRRSARARVAHQRGLVDEAAAHTAELPAVPPTPAPRPAAERENTDAPVA